jgi:hypothetical protein
MGHGGRSAPVAFHRRFTKPALQAARGAGGGSPSSSSQVRAKRCLFQGDSARWLPFAGAHLGGLVCGHRYIISGSSPAMCIVSELGNSLAWVGGASGATKIAALMFLYFNAQRQKFTLEPLTTGPIGPKQKLR